MNQRTKRLINTLLLLNLLWPFCEYMIEFVKKQKRKRRFNKERKLQKYVDQGADEAVYDSETGYTWVFYDDILS